MQLSIIIPIYNAETYLSKCIDCIMQQTFTDFELLLINDGSTDCSGEICEKQAKQDSRIRVFHKENGGVSSARNLGIEKAKGDWITFVDADDELTNENSLMALCSPILHNTDVDLSVCGYECYDVDGVKTFSTGSLGIDSYFNVENTISMMYECSYYQFYTIAKLYRASIIKDYAIRFDENIYFSEDRLFIIQYLTHCKLKTHISSQPIYKYLLRPGGAMNSLQMSFNYKSLTGFTAAIKMLKTLKEMGASRKNVRLAQKDIMTSYSITLANLDQYKINDQILRKELKARLREALPLPCFTVFITKHSLRKILKN